MAGQQDFKSLLHQKTSAIDQSSVIDHSQRGKDDSCSKIQGNGSSSHGDSLVNSQMRDLDEIQYHYWIYSDGACIKNPGPGAWAAVICPKEKSVTDSKAAIKREQSDNSNTVHISDINNTKAHLSSLEEEPKLDPSHPKYQEITGCEVETTNNRMEIMAAIQGIKALSHGSIITVVTDSEYLYKGITQWIKKWIRNGWRNTQRKPVLNDDLWKSLHSEVEHYTIHWRWTRGHDGHPGNERADTLASQCAQRMAKSLNKV